MAVGVGVAFVSPDHFLLRANLQRIFRRKVNRVPHPAAARKHLLCFVSAVLNNLNNKFESVTSVILVHIIILVVIT